MTSFLPGAVSQRRLAAVIGGALLIAFAPIFAILSTRGEDGVGMWDAAFWRVFSHSHRAEPTATKGSR